MMLSMLIVRIVILSILVALLSYKLRLRRRLVASTVNIRRLVVSVTLNGNRGTVRVLVRKV